MFQFRNNVLHCEGKFLYDNFSGGKYEPNSDVSLETKDHTEPYFVYSKSKLSENVKTYLTALDSLPAKSLLNFSLKANYNPHLIKVMIDSGLTGATCVSIKGQIKLKISSD